MLLRLNRLILKRIKRNEKKKKQIRIGGSNLRMDV